MSDQIGNCTNTIHIYILQTNIDKSIFFSLYTILCNCCLAKISKWKKNRRYYRVNNKAYIYTHDRYECNYNDRNYCEIVKFLIEKAGRPFPHGDTHTYTHKTSNYTCILFINVHLEYEEKPRQMRIIDCKYKLKNLFPKT